MSFVWGLALCASLGWLALRVTAQRMIFPRSRHFRARAEDAGLPVEEVVFAAEDGTRLHGWWFPHPCARGGLICCHGNAGNVSDRLWMAQDLADLRLHKLIFDYRGYGKSGGRPSEKGTGLDVAAAWDFVHARLGHPERPPIAVYGRSLGGAVALQLATCREVRALVLESTFTSILEMGRRHHPWLLPGLTCPHPYRSDLRIQRIKAPVLVAHSPDDEIVPYDMGVRLYEEAPEPKRFCGLHGGHAEAGWQTSPEYARIFREWLDAALDG